MTAIIRSAVASDLEGMLTLAERRRRQYATYQATFWRSAPDAVERQRPNLAGLIGDDAVITIVATTGDALAGFAIGTIVPAPPVYDPGGPTCVVDDFTVAEPEQWPSVGVELLREVGRTARQKEPHRSSSSAAISTSRSGWRWTLPG